MHGSVSKAKIGKTFRRSNLDEWQDLASRKKLTVAKGNECIVICADSRQFLSEIEPDSVSCAITSPPYGELKDYGTPDQLGFGQDIQTEYIPDLHKIFKDLFRIVEKGGALWVVLDMLRHAGETVVLPWEVISIARSEGWTFHDLVIWDKGKSLPWPNPGRFRGVCEYILLLGKGKLKTFNLNEARDSENLSPYWVKYPERYHPDGKAPSDLWHFPIPNQGTWSGSKLKHQCPFPVGLVERMISISTEKGDVVLDPFSGTGIVPAIAGHMGRFGIGIEINSGIVTELRDNRFRTLGKWIETELPSDRSSGNSLRKFIVELRMQKYAKTLYASLVRADELGKDAENCIALFMVSSAKRAVSGENDDLDSGNLGGMKLSVMLHSGADSNKVKASVVKRCGKQPLSLFGLNVEIEVVEENKWNDPKFFAKFPDRQWYVYQRGRFYSFDRHISGSELHENVASEICSRSKGVPTIISELKLSLESPPKDSISL